MAGEKESEGDSGYPRLEEQINWYSKESRRSKKMFRLPLNTSMMINRA